MDSEVKQHMSGYLKNNLRYDGRKLDEYRKVSVETNVSKSAEGSARVKIGNTEVMVGVKFELGKPYPDSPDEGTIMVGAELLPMSNPEFEAGPPSIQAVEIARVVDRGIRESHYIDFNKLCIKEGEQCWVVMIDIATINDEGNLFDASALGAAVALKNTKVPKIVDDHVDYKSLTDKGLPLSKKEPVSITVHKIGEYYLVDPTIEEEKNADARVTVAITSEGKICAMQKGGEEPLTQDDVEKMVDIASKKADELRKYLK